jgi:hypothetical protein
MLHAEFYFFGLARKMILQHPLDCCGQLPHLCFWWAATSWQSKWIEVDSISSSFLSLFNISVYFVLTMFTIRSIIEKLQSYNPNDKIEDLLHDRKVRLYENKILQEIV